MNAIIYEKQSFKILFYIPEVQFYNKYSITGDGKLTGINFDNVSVLITKHVVNRTFTEEFIYIYDPEYVPEEWLNDEYKIDLLE